MKKHQGFTIIELMIVVAIISILSAIALPFYQSYSEKFANNACLEEVKRYVGAVLVVNSNPRLAMPSPVASACLTIDAASGLAPITAIPKSPGTGSIFCDVANGGSCTLQP